MITSVTIENFKGVREPLTIDLKPVTLLFGANSAGKSTLLHSMLLAHELLANGNCNVDKTTIGGTLVDLGGFKEFVHGKDTSESVRLSFKLDLGDVDFSARWPLSEKLIDFGSTKVDARPVDDIFDGVTEFVLSWDERAGAAFVSGCEISLGDVIFAVLRQTGSGRRTGSNQVLYLNRLHPLWTSVDVGGDGGILSKLWPISTLTPEMIFDLCSPYTKFDLERLRDECVEFDVRDDFDPIAELESAARNSDLLGEDEAEYGDDDEDEDESDLVSDGEYPQHRIACSPVIDELCREDDVSFRVLYDPVAIVRNKLDFTEVLPERAILYRTTDGVIGCAALLYDAVHSEYLSVDDPLTWAESAGIPFMTRQKLSSREDFIELSVVATDDFPCLNQALRIEPPAEIADGEFGGVGKFDIEFLGQLLSRYILVPMQVLREELARIRYVGPIREIPSRGYAPSLSPDPARWASGLGAWDLLHTGPESLVAEVDHWLRAENRLNSKCGIERLYSQLSFPSAGVTAAPVSGLKWSARLGKQAGAPESVTEFRKTPHVFVRNHNQVLLAPNAVGVGISQVVPVVVSCIDGCHLQRGDSDGMSGDHTSGGVDDGRILIFEQPELHLHPRVQAALGDLFVEHAATRQHPRRHFIIIETHSEHLILRLQRRIRETEVNKAPADGKLRTDDLAIYYLKQEDGSSRALGIDVDVKGEFIQPWPDDFFEIDFYERFKTGEDG